MDTTRITEPLERLPVTGATIVSTVGDVTTNLADQITDRLADIDVEDTVRRGRRIIHRVVPWMSAGRPPSLGGSTRRRIVLGTVAVLVVTIVVVLRRRSSGPAASTTGRHDRTSGSAAGSMPATPPIHDREAVATGV